MTVFLDANVPMYLVGTPCPQRSRAEELLGDLIAEQVPLVTDAEVFQEILHRYAAIRRPDALQDAYQTLAGLVDDVFPVTLAEIGSAKSLVLEGVGARDAIHVATMRAHGVTRILTFDRGFDRFADLERLC